MYELERMEIISWVKKQLKEFAEKLKENLRVEKIILFGRRAEGNFDRNSDFDFIIVSGSFKGMNYFERVKKVYDFWDLDYPADFICYTKEEFNKLKKGITLVSIALKRGIEI
ncbi:MAG: nucleotidyltransferase domain-containing protein [Candidatus Pacearchaeota archaeon]